jgi:hypothetical protein
MDSNIRITPAEMAEAKRSLELWRKTKNDEQFKLMKGLQKFSNLGGTKLKKNKNRKKTKKR